MTGDEAYILSRNEIKENVNDIIQHISSYLYGTKSNSQTSGYSGDKITFPIIDISKGATDKVPSYINGVFKLPKGNMYEIVIYCQQGSNNISGQGGYRFYNETTASYIGLFYGITGGTWIPPLSMSTFIDNRAGTSDIQLSARFIAGSGVGVTLSGATISIKQV